MWVKGIVGARWFPYIAVGVIATVGIVFGWGYSKGYNKAEDVYLKQMNKALAEQFKRLAAQKDLEQKLALEAMEAKYEMERAVREVERPDDECRLSPPCVHWLNDVMRATTAHLGESD